MLNINIDYATDITVVECEFYGLRSFVVYDLTADTFGVMDNFGSESSRTYVESFLAVQSAVAGMVQYLDDEHAEADIKISSSGDYSGFRRGRRSIPAKTNIIWRNQPKQRNRGALV